MTDTPTRAQLNAEPAYTVAEVAHLCRVSPSRIRRWIGFDCTAMRRWYPEWGAWIVPDPWPSVRYSRPVTLSFDALLGCYRLAYTLRATRGFPKLFQCVPPWDERIKRRADGIPEALLPWRESPEEPPSIVVDPAVNFGRPYVHANGTPVFAIRGLLDAGDSRETVMREFRLTADQLDGALAWGLTGGRR